MRPMERKVVAQKLLYESMEQQVPYEAGSAAGYLPRILTMHSNALRIICASLPAPPTWQMA